MPDPRDLRRDEHDGTTFICAGSALLACYPSGDAGMRNVAVAVLRQLGFGGRTVAAVMGLTENYVATLHHRALREGTPGLVRERGRPGKLAARDWEQAARWRAEGASGSEIARRLRVAQSTVSRRLGPSAVQEQLPGAGPEGEAAAGGRRAEAGPQPEGEPGPQPGGPAATGQDLPPAGELPAGGREPSPGAGLARVAGGAMPSRYAGAMLAHSYLGRIGAEAILAAALPPALARPRYNDLGLLTATSLAFALGASSAEGTKHLIPAQAGILAGIGRLPDPRTLRPRLAAIAGACDPLALQRQLAAAMLAADAPGLHVYYVDDHFVPYEGAKPVPKGWNTKRRHAQPGRADTMVTDYQGRAVAFGTGEPSGLPPPCRPSWPSCARSSASRRRSCSGSTGAAPTRLPSAPSATPAPTGSPGGAARSPPSRPRRAGTGPPAATASPPRCSGWPMRPVTIKDYGQARQITLFEDGAPVLQVLTSDTDVPAAALLSWLRCRWRIENLFKYLQANYGIHWLCDYHAKVEDDDHLIANPERKAGRARLREAEAALAAAERALAGVISALGLSAAEKNQAIPAAEKKITTARQAVAAAKAALKPIPAKLPASQVTPARRKPSWPPAAGPCRWCCGCSPPPPSTGSATGSTTTCATPTSTAPSPATCSTSAARSPARAAPSP
jgi:hypothetical protein